MKWFPLPSDNCFNPTIKCLPLKSSFVSFVSNYYCFRRSCLVRASGRTTVGRWGRPLVTTTSLPRIIITAMTRLRPRTPRWGAGDTPEVTSLITTQPREAESPATRNMLALAGRRRSIPDPAALSTVCSEAAPPSLQPAPTPWATHPSTDAAGPGVTAG